ncbi:unnamed protein product [Adineta steineri]|uniref:Uncharacterized protein n=1 Tax=Adineta steineri TaxID=433720 RepID=A0A813SK16_9BILA|nr:unnamed protein product [Adineta steineri]
MKLILFLFILILILINNAICSLSDEIEDDNDTSTTGYNLRQLADMIYNKHLSFSCAAHGDPCNKTFPCCHGSCRLGFYGRGSGIYHIPISTVTSFKSPVRLTG